MDANSSPTKLCILLYEKETNLQKTSIAKVWKSRFPNKLKLQNSRIHLAWAEGYDKVKQLNVFKERDRK